MTPRPPLVLAIVGAVGLSLLVSACGGGGSGANVARIGTKNVTQPHAPQAYSACMRAHGVPSFPDPDSSGVIHIPTTIDDQVATVRAAYHACRSLAPSESAITGQGPVMQQNQLLAFAKCMRSHGIPTFPDPQTANGHLNFENTHDQFDPHSPIVTAAMAACRNTLGANSARGAEKIVLQSAASRPTGGKGK
jgi:hypothetical protein